MTTNNLDGQAGNGLNCYSRVEPKIRLNCLKSGPSHNANAWIVPIYQVVNYSKY